MVENKISIKMAKQLDLVVNRAGETFVDLAEKRAGEGGIDIGAISETDKRSMEELFSEVVNGQVVAEAAAIVSFLLYTELQDNNIILSRIVPGFMDRCEEQVTDAMVRKTNGLVELAQGLLDSEEEKSEVVTSLLQDIAGMAQARPMRATFNAVLLGLLGE